MFKIVSNINKIVGEITVSPDKSFSHRAIMLGAIANGVTRVNNFLMGADCLATVSCLKQLGADIMINNSEVIIKGKGLSGLYDPKETLYAANSGTTSRLLSGIIAGAGLNCTIDGDESLRKRPMGRVLTPLSLMGAKFEGNKCPFTINGGNLTGISYNSPVASAQVKSAILLAGLYAKGQTIVTEPFKSRDHTEKMLKFFGADLTVSGNTVTVEKCDRLFGQEIDVFGDISSAAFFIVAATILKDSEVRIKNVGINETRTGIAHVLLKMGANITYENVRTTVEPVCDIVVKSSKLVGTTISGAMIPKIIDEIPILCVAALFAEGQTIIADASELRVKESDRIKAVVTEFSKTGADIQETPDGIIINGGKKLKGASFKTYADHRMAMAESVLALNVDGEFEIDDKACVDVSFPDFYERLESICQ